MKIKSCLFLGKNRCKNTGLQCGTGWRQDYNITRPKWLSKKPNWFITKMDVQFSPRTEVDVAPRSR